MKRLGALLLALTGLQAHAAMVLDGKLDEPEWQQAQRFEDFKTTEPTIGTEPELKTTVLLFTDADGIHIGVICDQPPSIGRARLRGQRDQFVAGDRINLALDFDGTGTTAYEFTAYLAGGEKQDSIISRQVNYNYDWDGDWDYAVSETRDQWFVEYRIPWDVAPMGEPHDGKQTIGVFFSRFVVATGRRYSLPANTLNRATFVSDMRKIEIAAHERAHLDLFPYVSASRDIVKHQDKTRAGLDVFWKPSGRQQLTATVNPDFGQVESDKLVVNLTAIPTFYPDKRPFFTENLGLFSTEINVLYTRRIGAAPDCVGANCVPSQPTTPILGALKYTGSSGAADYGLITAWEDNTSQARGRDFYVGRARYRLTPAFSFGWMGTYTERPTLGRRADANALDIAWTPAPGVSLSAQGVVDEAHQQAATFLDPDGTGSGARLTFGYAPDGPLESTTVAASKSRRYNISDAGYQQRPSEHVMETINTYYWRDWAAQSAVQVESLRGDLVVHTNDSGQVLPTFFTGNWDWTRRDTSFGGIEYDLVNAGGADDVITCGADPTDPTCGHAPAKLPVRHWGFLYYGSPRVGLFRYFVVAGVGTGYFTNHGYSHLRIEPGLYPTDTFSLTSSIRLIQAPDELISWGGPVLGAFEYEEQTASIDLNWFPVARNELRVKFQWSAYSLDPLAAYRPASNGDLFPSGDPLSPLTRSTTALQLRYRWEFAPQSDLYFVYTHGGQDLESETGRGLGASLRRGFVHEIASEFLLKVRYRFVVL